MSGDITRCTFSERKAFTFTAASPHSMDPFPKQYATPPSDGCLGIDIVPGEFRDGFTAVGRRFGFLEGPSLHHQLHMDDGAAASPGDVRRLSDPGESPVFRRCDQLIPVGHELRFV
jgi:hypothetical protein